MIGWIILGIVLIFLAVLVIRALCFNPKPQPKLDAEPIAFDKDSAVSALQKLVQCKTISNVDPALEDDAEFEKLIALLPELYPDILKVCSFTRFPDRGLLFHWKGKARFSLEEGLEEWKSYLGEIPGDRCLLLEFMPNDTLEELPTQTAALRKLTEI